MKFKLIACMILAVGALGNSPLSAMQKPKDLIQAAKDGDLERVRVLISALNRIETLINKEAYLDQIDAKGNTALIWAAYNGHLDVVKALLAAGANVNAQSNEGYTPLMNAIAGNHLDIVKELIQAKNINPISKQKALIYASSYGKPDIVKELIRLNYDIDKKTGGYTPLQNTTFLNSQDTALEVAKALLTEYSNADAERLLAIMFSLKESGMQDMIQPMIQRSFIEERLQRANQSIKKSLKYSNGKDVRTALLEDNYQKLAALLDPDNQDSQNELRQLITKNIRAIEDHINEILKAKSGKNEEPKN